MVVFAISFVFVLTVVIAPAVPVSLTIAIPAVIVLEAAVLSLPVAVVVSAVLPARSDPSCASIRWVSPITTMPNVVAIYHVPIAVHPDVAGARCNGSHTIHTRRGWSADPDSDGYLSFKGG